MHHLKRKTIPFTAIVGQDDMKFSLILNAINPRIGGVLIRGDKGTAKSTAVRALADLWKIFKWWKTAPSIAIREILKICATCVLRRTRQTG